MQQLESYQRKESPNPQEKEISLGTEKDLIQKRESLASKDTACSHTDGQKIQFDRKIDEKIN